MHLVRMWNFSIHMPKIKPEQSIKPVSNCVQKHLMPFLALKIDYNLYTTCQNC